MEGRNGQCYEESQETDSSIKKLAAAFGIENVTINKVKHPPATNVFRVVSDPSALSITRVASGGGGAGRGEKPAAGVSPPMGVTITKIAHTTKTETSVQHLSSGSVSHSDFSSDASRLDEDSYDSGSFYSANGDYFNVDSSNPNKVRAYECEDCGKTFKRSDHLKKHKTTHTGLKPYECDECHKRYTQSGSLKTHKLVHSRPKVFPCGFCPREFTQVTSLHLHRKIHLCVPKKFECLTCGRGYDTLEELTDHRRCHSDNMRDRKFSCDICGKTFTQKGNLNTHKMIHDNIRPHKCDVCNKEFVQKNNYLLHMKTHMKHSTSGHILAASPLRLPISHVTSTSSLSPTAESHAKEELTNSELEEEDDGYLDDFVVGTFSPRDPQPLTSTPEKEKSSAALAEDSGSGRRDTHKQKIKRTTALSDSTSSVPFVCIDCNNKPFSEKCRLNNHKMYVLF